MIWFLGNLCSTWSVNCCSELPYLLREVTKITCAQVGWTLLRASLWASWCASLSQHALLQQGGKQMRAFCVVFWGSWVSLRCQSSNWCENQSGAFRVFCSVLIPVIPKCWKVWNVFLPGCKSTSREDCSVLFHFCFSVHWDYLDVFLILHGNADFSSFVIK